MSSLKVPTSSANLLAQRDALLVNDRQVMGVVAGHDRFTDLASIEPQLSDRQMEKMVTGKAAAPNSSSQRLHLRILRRLLEWEWLEECLCCVLVVAAFAALVGMLSTAQHRSTNAWRDQHHDISINAIVAILSAVLKGAAMLIIAEVIGQTKWHWFNKPRVLYDFESIDGASRGPWGSMKMLFRRRGPTLAIFGACITIIALAVDPFTQNIITSHVCQALSTNQTTIVPTADKYDKTQGWHNRTDPDQTSGWGTYQYGLDAAIKASIYSGLYGATTTVVNASTIRIGCPGVNCTYPRYTTLAICHQCADISSHIESSCSVSPVPNDGVFHPPCNLSLPTGQVISSFADNDDYSLGEEIMLTFAVANATTSTLELPHRAGIFTNVTLLLNSTADTNCTMDDRECRTTNGGPTFNFTTLAVECSLFPCTRTFTAITLDGVVVETEVKRTYGPEDWGTNSWQQSNPDDPHQVPINPHENCTWEAPSAPAGAGPCTYVAGDGLLLAAGDFFWQFWNSTMSGVAFYEAATSNEALNVLYNRGSTSFDQVDHVFGSVADSMTAAVRLTGENFYRGEYWSPIDEIGEGSGIVTGQVYLADTCIGVRWRWIALPATVTALTLLLFVLTLTTRKAGNGESAWKCSSLPVLLHGLSPSDTGPGGEHFTASEMKQIAKGLLVQNSGTLRDQWHLKAQQGQSDKPQTKDRRFRSSLLGQH